MGRQDASSSPLRPGQMRTSLADSPPGTARRSPPATTAPARRAVRGPTRLQARPTSGRGSRIEAPELWSSRSPSTSTSRPWPRPLLKSSREISAGLATLAHASALRPGRRAPRRALTASDQTTLDEWLARHRRYDAALTALRTASTSAKFHQTSRWPITRRTWPGGAALDSRALIVIVAEIARGGCSGGDRGQDARAASIAPQEFALTSIDVWPGWPRRGDRATRRTA